jgi:hypothetical protein
LTEILRIDPAARRQYRQFMALHADLHWDDAVAAVMQPGERTGSWRQVWKWKGAGKRAVGDCHGMAGRHLGQPLVFTARWLTSQSGTPDRNCSACPTNCLRLGCRRI